MGVGNLAHVSSMERIDWTYVLALADPFQSVAHPARSPFVPTKVWSHVGAVLAASLADEPRLDIRQPHIVGPPIGRHRDRVAATIVHAIDQDPSRAAAGPHLAEGDLCRAHAA